MEYPILMGILNVTPDSFSDGGSWIDPRAAVAHAEQMIADGAQIIDVGGESTRPGHAQVSFDEEIRRIEPVVKLLGQKGIRFSIDTQKAAVAEVALDHGASLVNDVSSLSDPAMAHLVAQEEVDICLMHWNRAFPTTATVHDIATELASLAARAREAGIAEDRIWLDPGIGFGKTTAQNLSIIRDCAVFGELGYPVLIGLSRKSVIGKTLGSEDAPVPVSERAAGTLTAELHVARAMARQRLILRTHDVRSLAQALIIQRTLTKPC